MTCQIGGNVGLNDDQVSELQAQIGVYYNHAIGYAQGELGVKCRLAWEYYYGRLPEPVTDGSSKWVDRAVWEAVNGTLQELISVFTSGEEAVRFCPMFTGDADAARASTKLVNKVLLRDNQGYNVLHDAFKECLVARNSFIKRYWSEKKKTVIEEFEDMSQDELNIYLSSLEGDIIEMNTEEVEAEDDEEGSESTFRGDVTYEIKKEGVVVEYVPFEQVTVEPTATSLQDCNYIAHHVRKSKDELLQMGFLPEIVQDLQPASSDIEVGVIANARINNLSPLNVSDVLVVGDEKADKLWLHEHYLKTSLVDGFEEILQVFTVHNQILEVNRVNEFPFETMTPFPIPGSIWGESVFDITKDIQDLTTSIVRGMIDNIMNANFRRYQAVTGAFDRKSLLNNRPGAVIEVQQIGAVQPFDYHQLPPGITNLLEYVEGKKEMRTGVSKLGQGLDPSVFKNDNSFATVNMMLTTAQNRLRMVARNIAQRGMMQLMLGIYNLIRQNGKEPIRIETANGEITIDPRTLPPRNEMIVSVAVGEAERRERAQSLQAIMMAMTQTPQLQQFFQPNNAYFLAAQMMESMGITDVENFITPLDKIPPPQPDPMQEMNMQAMQEQIKQLQVTTQKMVQEVMQDNRKAEFEQIKAADEISIRRGESQAKQEEITLKMSIDERKLMLDERRIAIEEQLAGIQQEKNDIKREELLLEAQLEERMQRPVALGAS